MRAGECFGALGRALSDRAQHRAMLLDRRAGPIRDAECGGAEQVDAVLQFAQRRLQISVPRGADDAVVKESVETRQLAGVRKMRLEGTQQVVECLEL